jgi:fluoride exporter
VAAVRRLAWIALGGAIGGTARYGLMAALSSGEGRVPWVVFGENVGGAFVLGWVVAVLTHWKRDWDPRPLLCTGILGSFTTFSTLSWDIVQLTLVGTGALGIAYGLASIVAGLSAAALGMGLGDRLRPEGP